MKILFLGMGLMGSRMASRLLAAGHTVLIWNRSLAACEPLLAAGATAAQPADLASAEVIAMCLSDDEAVEQVASQWFGECGDKLHPGQVVVDFSSGSPQLARRWTDQLMMQGAHWVDAPVSGGVQGAEQGTLVIFAGGEADIINRLQPVWQAISQRISHMGGSGSGQVTKLCNQLIVAASSTLIAEAIRLAEASGVDASQLAPALAGGFADSKPLQILAPRMATGQFLPLQWKVKTLRKDLDNAYTLARQQQLTLPVAERARLILASHAMAHADEDLSTLIQSYRQ